MIIETRVDDGWGDVTLTIDGHVYSSGSPAPVWGRWEEIMADQGRYIREGCPAWDACVAKARQLGLPTSYREDLTVIDLHYMMQEAGKRFVWCVGPTGTHIIFEDEQQISRRIAAIADLYPQNVWYLWGRGYLEATTPALAMDVLATPAAAPAKEPKVYPSGEYDTALPQTWVYAFEEATEFNPRGQFVWSYASADIFGVPFPLTEAARAALARYEAHCEAEDERRAGA